MASRNNGDDPPNGKGEGGRPGSYVKIAGSRRRRRGRKQLPSTRPAPAALAEPLEPEPSAEPSEESSLDEPFDPPVDDLRSSRAVAAHAATRRPQGPLGMDDARPAAPAPSSVAPMRVIEINAPPRGSDNTNDAPAPAHDDRLGSEAAALPVEPRLARTPAEMDEPFAPPSTPPPSHPPRARDDDRFADDEELRKASEPPGAHAEPPEPERVPAAQLVGHAQAHGFVMGREPHPEDEVEHTPRAGFSTVFNARPSLRPSPPPPPRSAVGWWLAVLLLSGIIVAAGVVAVREEMEAREPDVTARHEPSQPTPPESATPPSAQAPAEATPPVAEPLPEVTSSAPAAMPDAGAKATAGAAVTTKPARVWKPRKLVGDAAVPSAKSRAPAPAAGEAAPVEAVPANPYGSTPEIR